MCPGSIEPYETISQSLLLSAFSLSPLSPLQPHPSHRPSDLFPRSQLGKDRGQTLLDVMMHMKVSDITDPSEAPPKYSGLRKNERMESIEDDDGNVVVKKVVERMVDVHGRAHASGTRKNAVAQVWVKENPRWDDPTWEGLPAITVNGVPYEDYWKDLRQRKVFLYPLLITDTPLQWDIEVRVTGGGFMGQAGAARLALARAMQNYEPGLRDTLLTGECLTVDPRQKERKKVGRTRARRSPQWSKR